METMYRFTDMHILLRVNRYIVHAHMESLCNLAFDSYFVGHAQTSIIVLSWVIADLYYCNCMVIVSFVDSVVSTGDYSDAYVIIVVVV